MDKTQTMTALKRIKVSRVSSTLSRLRKDKGNTWRNSDSLLMKLFIDQIRDIYWAEEHLMDAYHMMMKRSNSKALLQLFAKHLKETEWHADRLIRVFNMTGKNVSTKRCEAMAGIIAKQAEIAAGTHDDRVTRDIGLILAAQKAEHYEIATYGGLIRLAHTFGLDEVAEILEKTLSEEMETEKQLSALAKEEINLAASGEEE